MAHEGDEIRVESMFFVPNADLWDHFHGKLPYFVGLSALDQLRYAVDPGRRAGEAWFHFGPL